MNIPSPLHQILEQDLLLRLQFLQLCFRGPYGVFVIAARFENFRKAVPKSLDFPLEGFALGGQVGRIVLAFGAGERRAGDRRKAEID